MELLFFSKEALATGLLYGRFSKPSTCIRFSRQALITAYHGMTALEFRIANERASWRADVYFFPLSWTIVHPITDESPLLKKNSRQTAGIRCEILVLFKRAFYPDEGGTITMDLTMMDDVENVLFVQSLPEMKNGLVKNNL